MDVRIINGGSDAYRALLYPLPDQHTRDYLRHQIEVNTSRLGDVGESYYAQHMDTFNRFNSDSAITAAKAFVHSAGTHFSQDVIYPINNDNIQNANLVMQQYIMSNPIVDKLYSKDMCYGFMETYIDPQPGAHGEDRVDYQKVMDGVVQFEKDDAYVMYYSNGEDELNIIDKLSILDTWHTVEQLIANDIDPTDPDLNEL